MADITPPPNAWTRSLATGRAAWARASRKRRNAKPLWPRVTWFNAAVIVWIAAIAWFFAYGDAAFTRWARGLPDRVEDIFQVITAFGSSAWILTLTGALGIIVSLTHWRDLAPPRRAARVALHGDATFLFFTIAGAGTLIALVKNTIGRGRPKWLDEYGMHYFDFAAFEASFASFPSGHSTTFGALTMGLVLLFPRWRWVCLVVSLIGGFSRVAVGAHYLSDVMAGLACGALFTLLAARFLAQRGIMFARTPGVFPPRRRYSAANPFSRSA